ncbi:transporter substrate-binding domain-containing protein [Thalassospiraceae bacterium SW-3-3]|nr:transporter substrate-binding domain-containing protein [Thalassospiraceae bacterium SW-3-3]
MMRWRKYRAVSGLIGLVALPFMAVVANADAPGTLTWAVPPFAPAFISEDGKLTGYASDTQNWFAARLDDYQQEIMEVPLARLLAEMRNGAADDHPGHIRCSTTLIPTDERREYISFAKTILLHLPISVVIRAEDEENFKPFLDEEGHIQLGKLMANGDMTTALRIGRSYGALIDNYVERYRNAPQIMRMADDSKLLKLLELGRIDWTFYFPSEAEFYRRETAPNQMIKSLPIRGNTNLLEATIGCAKTPAGQQAIARINQIVATNPDMPWTNFYAAWLSPQDREWFVAARAHYIDPKQFEALLTPRK